MLYTFETGGTGGIVPYGGLTFDSAGKSLRYSVLYGGDNVRKLLWRTRLRCCLSADATCARALEGDSTSCLYGWHGRRYSPIWRDP